MTTCSKSATSARSPSWSFRRNWPNTASPARGETAAVDAITPDDLAELMGGGDEGDSQGLPEGMTFEDDSAASLAEELGRRRYGI